MNYLARLKQLDSGEIFHNTPKPEPTKPTEPPFDGFVGSIPGANENIYIEKGVVETDSATAHWHWLVRFADRDPVEVYCNPDADFANIMQTYPNALAAVPIPERIPQAFTEAEDAEWEALWVKPAEASCATCLHSRRPGGVSRYCCARPDLPPAYGDGHPLRCLPNDGGTECERWVSRILEVNPAMLGGGEA